MGDQETKHGRSAVDTSSSQMLNHEGNLRAQTACQCTGRAPYSYTGHKQTGNCNQFINILSLLSCHIARHHLSKSFEIIQVTFKNAVDGGMIDLGVIVDDKIPKSGHRG